MMEPRQDPPQLADWWPRVGATLLDGLIIWGLSIAAVIVTAIGAFMSPAVDDAGRADLPAGVGRDDCGLPRRDDDA